MTMAKKHEALKLDEFLVYEYDYNNKLMMSDDIMTKSIREVQLKKILQTMM